MDKSEVAYKMACNRVFVQALDKRFGILQTVQSLAQSAIRSPEPIKSALSEELGNILCLIQQSLMFFGEKNRMVQSVSMVSLGKVAEMTHCDLREVIKDLETIYGDGARIMIYTLENWADQVLNAHLWEKTTEALQLPVKTA